MKIFILVSFILFSTFVTGEPSRQKRLIDSLIGKKCVTDDDCGSSECCTPTYSTGMRCRGFMTEGTICSSFTEELIKRLHRRCPCETGTSCKNTGSILGIYKINRCVKDNA